MRQFIRCQILRLEVTSIYAPIKYVRMYLTKNQDCRAVYQFTKYAVVLYPPVALSASELDTSRGASMEPEKVGIASERGARERRSKRLSVSPNMTAVDIETVKY